MNAVTLLCLAFAASALGQDQESTQRHCLPNRKPNYGIGNFFIELQYRVLGCVAAQNVNNPEYINLNDYNTYLKHTCSSMTVIQSCVQEQRAHWEMCHNDTLLQLFEVSREAVESFVSELCKDGDSLPKFFHRLYMQGQGCLEGPARRVKVVSMSGADVASQLWYLHYELCAVKACLLDVVDEDEDLHVHAHAALDRVLDRLRCVHPRDGDLVPCVDVEWSLVDHARMCPMWSDSLGSVLEREAVTALGPEDFASGAETRCRDQHVVRHALDLVRDKSRICQSPAEGEVLAVVVNYYQAILEAACFDLGHTAASLYEVAGPALRDCLQQVVDTRNNNYTDPGRVMGYYRELDVIRDCVLERADNNTAVASNLDTLINNIRGRMKCFDPDNEHLHICPNTYCSSRHCTRVKRRGSNPILK